MSPIGSTVAQFTGLPADWIVSMAPQQSEEWFAARRGVITGSMAKVARETKKDGSCTSAALTYAKDTARARAGAGDGEPVFVNAAMRFGTEQEPIARMAYELQTGSMVDAAGFISAPDRKFGVSIDGLVLDVPGERGGIEIKTIVSSNVLFDTVVDGDISAYMDQVSMNTWAWHLDWIDLCLWAPDLPTDAARLTVIRIHRNQAHIDALLADLVEFDRLVDAYANKLRRYMSNNAKGITAPPPWDDASEPTPTPATKPAKTTTAPADFADASF